MHVIRSSSIPKSGPNPAERHRKKKLRAKSGFNASYVRSPSPGTVRKMTHTACARQSNSLQNHEIVRNGFSLDKLTCLAAIWYSGASRILERHLFVSNSIFTFSALTIIEKDLDMLFECKTHRSNLSFTISKSHGPIKLKASLFRAKLQASSSSPAASFCWADVPLLIRFGYCMNRG